MLAIAGDFNMEPDEWDQDILDKMGLVIVKVGSEKTCKTSHGSKQSDYLLVSTDMAQFIDDIKLEADAPWNPHTAISFSINKKPGRAYHQAMVQPDVLPYVKEDDGKILPWIIEPNEWQVKLEDAKAAATEAINSTENDDTWGLAAR